MPRKGDGLLSEGIARVHSKPKEDKSPAFDHTPVTKTTNSGDQGCWVRPKNWKCPTSLVTNMIQRNVTSTPAQIGSGSDDDSSDDGEQPDPADSVMDSEEGDEPEIRGISEKVNFEPLQGQRGSRNTDNAYELRAIAKEINGLKKSQAILEGDNEQWRRAFEEMEEERDSLIHQSHVRTQRYVIKSSQQNDEIKELSKEVQKLEQKLEDADRDTSTTKRQLRKVKDERDRIEESLKTSKSEAKELEGKLVKAHKLIKSLKFDIVQVQDTYTNLISDITELFDAINILDNVPFMVIEAAEKLSDKVFRPWKFRKN